MSIKEQFAVYKQQIKWFWRIFFIGAGVVMLFIILLSLGVFGKLPSFEELENPRSNLSTQIISSDGELLGRFYRENRTNATFKEFYHSLQPRLHHQTYCSCGTFE